MFRYPLMVLLALVVTGPAWASSWADRMFESLSRDFGSVPRGPIITHHFRLVNNTGHPVRIASVRVSCGCVTARALHQELAPGQESAILIEMDTRRFYSTRLVTIFVTFDQPHFAEVRLWVQATSRDDVSVQPDTLAFGRIKHGTSPRATVRVACLGNPNWRITSAMSDTNYVQPSLRLVQQSSYEVAYELSATLRHDAPPGRWYTDLWLNTNNPSLPRIRVPVTVEIESALSISPSNVILGTVKAGTEAQRKVILRGVEPFRVTGIKGGDREVRVFDSTDEAKTVHVLTVTVRPTRTGEWTRHLQVLTDLRGESVIEFTTRAQVVP